MSEPDPLEKVRNVIFRQQLATICALCSFTVVACDGSSPTSPESTGAFSGTTTVHVQPDAALTPDDPSGMVSLAVWPFEAGGAVSIDVCVDDAGQPIAAGYDLDAGCVAQDGRWVIARDQAGDPWISRSWWGQTVVRFDRRAGQAPMLFRVAYVAPDGGATRNVTDCRWLLAEHNDVGIACTSDGTARQMPWTMAGAGSDSAR